MTETLAPSQPLVTVGVPVRNGASMLAAALETVVRQTWSHLEIIISDNGSTDGTAEICQRFAAADPRIRYHRQERFLSAFENFEFVLQQAQGEFFLWAAYDDLRSENFVEVLVAGLQQHPTAILAFSDLLVGTPQQGWQPARAFQCENTSRSVLKRLHVTASRQCYHIYGVWRTAAIRRSAFRNTFFWPDLPVMMGASALGTFIHVPGATFSYYEVPKTNEDRLKADSNVGRKRFLILRVTWGTFRNLISVGAPLLAPIAAWFVFAKRLHAWIDIEVRGVCYRLSPDWIRLAWRGLKQRLRRHPPVE